MKRGRGRIETQHATTVCDQDRCVFEYVPHDQMIEELQQFVDQSQKRHCIVKDVDGFHFNLYYTNSATNRMGRKAAWTRCVKFSWVVYALEYAATRLALDSMPLDRGKVSWNRDTAKARTREAINWWVLCARRLGVVKDIRRKISEELLERQHLWIP